MSLPLINRSADLYRLRNEGYHIEIRSGYLVVHDVPYVTANREVATASLVTELSLRGEETTRPRTHVAYFTGEFPCDVHGYRLEKIHNQSQPQQLTHDLLIQHTFSSKPTVGYYTDYYELITTYIAMITSQAQALNPSVTAQTYPVIETQGEESVFQYIDTASSRAGIMAVAEKLRHKNIAIVGLGGTGSYILDLVAKTPVQTIHLFDGDIFSQHNAFRSPGAPSVGDLRQQPNKALFFQSRYISIHKNIIAHPIHIDETTVDQLQVMDFIFLSLDNGESRQLIVPKLEKWQIAFVDVGMGLYLVDNAIGGQLRMTCSTPTQRDNVRHRIPFGTSDIPNEYTQNIQVADLNALNAVLAVIKWKKLMGVYVDEEHEHFCTYTLGWNTLINDDTSYEDSDEPNYDTQSRIC